METKKYIGSGLKESGANLNVLNVLRVLIEDEDTVVYMPAGYERGTRKRVDEHVHHGHRYAPVAMPVSGFVSHMERFNFSVRGLKEVLVENDQTNELEPKKVFRTYNIIRDGELLIDKLEAKLSEEAFYELVPTGIVQNQVGKTEISASMHIDDYVYTINLSELPLVSTHWAQPERLKFVEMIREEHKLTELLKNLNKLKREYEAIVVSDGGSHHESDVYVEKTQYAEEEPTDFYSVSCVAYRVKGEKHQFEMDKLREMYPNLNILNTEIKGTKKYLSNIRFLIRAIAFAIENTKNQGSKTFQWSDVKPLPRSKTKKFQCADLGEGLVIEKLLWEEQVPV